MEILSDPTALRERCREFYRSGRTIGFVPTMGNLHAGHLSLLRQSAADCDLTVGSIFVNPLQFGPTEDLDAYPRTFRDDCEQAEAAGANLMFAPTTEVMYPEGFATSVTVSRLTEGLCGRSRPGHFEGVTTVVMKLLCLVLPHRAYFGEKDYQQYRVIDRMTRDLGLGVEIVGMPIVREPDGLAMSSRNGYLNETERRAATVLNRALREVQELAAAGRHSVDELLGVARERLAREPLARIDYLELVDPSTLAPLTALDRPGRLILAVWVGPARLLDNGPVTPPERTGGPTGS